MIPNETILEVSATMIVGVLFVITIIKAFDIFKKIEARVMLFFCAAGVIPFSLSAVSALFDINILANIVCSIGFMLFPSILTFVVYLSAKMEEDAHQ